MADEYNPYDLGFTGPQGSMYVLPGEGGGERAETGLTVPTDDSGYIGETGLPPGVTPGTPGIGWGTPGGLGTFLTDIQQGRLTDAIGGLFSGRTGGALGQMAAFGGLAALLNKMFGDNSQKPVGYQGGIPKYTYERTQTPMAQQRPAGYRPGQGGITYFTGGQYTPTGKDLAAPAAGEATPALYGASVAPGAGGTTQGAIQGGISDLIDRGERRRPLFSSGGQDAAPTGAPIAQSPSGYQIPIFSPTNPALVSPSGRSNRDLGLKKQIADLQALQLAAGVPSNPLEWTPADKQKVAQIQNEYLGMGEFGALAVDPQSGVTSRTPYQMYGTLSPEMRAKADAELRVEIPKIAEKAMSFGGGPEHFRELAAKYRLNEQDLFGFLTPQQQEYFAPALMERLQGMKNRGAYDPATYGSSLFGYTMSVPELEFAAGGMMPGSGIAMLARGRYLKGKGDGVSDSIPAQFAGSGQKALLADGEFVIPARVVSELGNGSSDAGARKLYAMLDRVEARAKKAKRGKPSGADRELNKLA